MSSFLSLRCESCNARIKAPIQLHGQTRSCPRCRHRFVVGGKCSEDAGPILVLDDRPVGMPSSAWSAGGGRR